jgi:O-antigen/teichoic acid export membrane protein
MFKDVVNGVAKNTSIMLFQQVVTWGANFLLMFFLARYLGPVEYGKVFLAGSIAFIFGMFVDYGSIYSIAKKVSRSRENTGQILVDAVSFRFIFGLVALTGMVILSFAMGYPTDVRILLLIMGLGFLWSGAIASLRACYQGHEVMQYTSAGTIAKQVLVSLASVVALLLGAKATAIVIIGTVGSFVNFLLLVWPAKNIINSLPRVSLRRVIQELKEGAPYFLLVVFSGIYFRIDSVMLSKMAPEAVVGWYGAAYRLFEGLNFVPVIFSTAVYPVLSRLWEGEEAIHRRTMQKSLELMIITGIPITVGVIVFAGRIIHLFYGISGYGPSVPTLQLLGCGLLLMYVDMILGTTLLASDKQRAQSILALCAIPLNVGLNYLLIPFYESHAGNGGLGAAIATGLTELCIMLAMLALMPRGIFRGFRFGVLGKGLLAGLLMAGSIWLSQSMGLPWVIEALVCAVVYVTSLPIMKTFEPSELRFLLGLFTIQNLKHFRGLLIADKTSLA